MCTYNQPTKIGKSCFKSKSVLKESNTSHRPVGTTCAKFKLRASFRLAFNGRSTNRI